jgi:hypothetical protein
MWCWKGHAHESEVLAAGVQKSSKKCHDNDDSCAAWAEGGECSVNPAYMKKHCADSCNSGCESDSLDTAAPTSEPVPLCLDAMNFFCEKYRGRRLQKLMAPGETQVYFDACAVCVNHYYWHGVKDFGCWIKTLKEDGYCDFQWTKDVAVVEFSDLDSVTPGSIVDEPHWPAGYGPSWSTDETKCTAAQCCYDFQLEYKLGGS